MRGHAQRTQRPRDEHEIAFQLAEEAHRSPGILP
jgi:hypothetical protein